MNVSELTLEIIIIFNDVPRNFANYTFGFSILKQK